MFLFLPERSEEINSKIRAVLEWQLRPQFSEFRLANESALFHIHQNTADLMGRLNFENCGLSPIP